MKIKYISILALLLVISSGLAINVDQTEYGHTMKLLNVGSGGSIIIEVDGVVDTITADSTKVVNGVEITVLETHYSALKEERSAEIRITFGEESTDTTQELTLKVYPVYQRNEFFFDVGETKTVEGALVTLVNVGSEGSIILDVNGKIRTLPPTETWKAGGLAIKIVETYYASIKEERAATLAIVKSYLSPTPIPIGETEQITSKCNFNDVCELGESSSCGDCNFAPGWSCNHNDVCESGEPNRECDDCVGIIPISEVKIQSTQQVEISNVGLLHGDLMYYPKFFAEIPRNRELGVYIVVGDSAPASDILAATEIGDNIEDALEMDADPFLVSDVGTKISESNNYIVVGNDAVKGLDVENLLKLEPLKKGEGLIQVFKDRIYTIVTVTGYSDADTRNAAEVLSKWQQYSLRGKWVKVKSDGQGNFILSYSSSEELIEPSRPIQQSPSCIINGICEPEYGEDETNCARDCKNINIPLQCQGCLKDETCLNFGIRFLDEEVPKYCDIDKQIHLQKSSNEVCQNNFECDSNLCISDRCVSQGLWKRMMSWFGRTFGFVVKQ